MSNENDRPLWRGLVRADQPRRQRLSPADIEAVTLEVLLEQHLDLRKKWRAAVKASGDADNSDDLSASQRAADREYHLTAMLDLLEPAIKATKARLQAAEATEGSGEPGT